jgi:hypothetical protein
MFMNSASLLLQLKLKEKLSLYDYRVFLKVVHFHVFRLVEVNGVEKSSRFLNKGAHKIYIGQTESY